MHWPASDALAHSFKAIAADEGVTPAQLSLAWVQSRGPHIHAIPGTANQNHLAENIASPGWQADGQVLARVDALINRHTVSGPRYPAAMQATMDTEEFG